jgi:prepilin-type N-terminal cleavage/methylation domain-containing protein
MRQQLKHGFPLSQAGFTLVELLVSIVILLVGIVAAAQLVATAIDFNLRNRYDSTGLIVAQRQLEQMVRQPLTVKGGASVTDYNFTDTDGVVCYIGAVPNPETAPPTQAAPGPVQSGCPVVNGFMGFAAPCTATGYFKVVNAGANSYDVRWNVVTIYGNNNGKIGPVQKRITIAARATSGRFLSPTSLSVLVGP